MATDSETFNRDLYDLLKVRGYKPVPLSAQNQRVPASQTADVIQFNFIKDGEDYGKAWITVDDAQNIVIYYDQEQQESPSTPTRGVEYDDSWTGLLKHLKNWAQRRQMSFELANKDRLGDDMKQREYYKMKEKLGESYHPMGKKASYNDAVPSVKIILQHNRALEEGEQRYRNVARIFLENQDGERFLAPTNRPGIARVYARHIAEGGLPNDEKWNHIKSICEDYNKMGGFVRATRNGQFNESAQELVNEGINHYNNLRETLKKLSGHRGYHAYFESWTPTLMEGEGEDISEMFMSTSMDPRIEAAMPILSKLHKPITEMDEVSSLAEWADDVLNEKLEVEEAANIASKAIGMLGSTVKQGIDMTAQAAGGVVDQVTNSLGGEVSEGEVIPFKKKHDDDDEDWDDESWIPSIEDFEQEEEIRNRKRGPANDVNEMGGDQHYSDTKGAWDLKAGKGKPIKVKDFAKKAGKELNKAFKKAFKGEVDESDAKKNAADTKKTFPNVKHLTKGGHPDWKKHKLDIPTKDEVDEDLDANQKRVGQLGPTEKVKNNNIGKLVGASESKEMDPELARIIEMAKFKR